MIDIDRAIKNIEQNFQECGFEIVPENRCFITAIVSGIYKEIFENGEVLLKRNLQLEDGPIVIENGRISLSSEIILDEITTPLKIG